MKIRSLVAVVGTTALAAIGVLAVATPASAHTPAVSATCSTLTVDLANYAAQVEAKDAVYHDWDETIIDSPAVPGTPAVYQPVKVVDSPAVPAVPAVTHTEYEFAKLFPFKTHWDSNPNWNSENNEHSLGWFATGHTQVVIDTPAVPAIPEVSHIVQQMVTPEVPGVPAVTHTVPHHDLVSAAVQGETNHVIVTIDDAVVDSADFGSTYSNSFTFDNQYVEHTWNVAVSAWDSSDFDLNQSGTTEACAVPVVPAQTATTVTASCGSAVVDITNPQADWTQNLTGAVTIWVDGKFKEAVAIFGGGHETRTYTFAEDSGNHHVVVKNAESAGGQALAEADVTSDCIAPQPEAQVVTSDWTDGSYACGDTTVEQTRTVTTTPFALVEGEWVLDTENADVVTEHQTRDLTAAEVAALDCPVAVVTPPTTTPVAAAPAAAPVAPVASNTDVLAHTGSDISAAIGVVALALILSGCAIFGSMAFRRRKAAHLE